MSADEELLTFQRLLLAFDTPAYLRRARQVQGEWDHLQALCRRERARRLELPRLRLAQLFAAADAERCPERLPVSADELITLQHWYAEWRPTLRSPLRTTHSAAEVRDRLQQLAFACGRFNRDWEAYLAGLDLAPLNDLRDRYNRFYVLEKECAVRSTATARDGFQPLPPVTTNDLRNLFPPLPIPRLDRQ